MDIQTRDDCVQIQTAANNRFPVTMDQRTAAVQRLLEIISDPSSNGRLVVSATKALAAMDKLNMDEQPRQTHSVNLNLNIDDKKSELSKRIESLRGSLGSANDD